MLHGPLLKFSVPNLDIDHNLIDTISGCKLLGVHISSKNLSQSQYWSALSEKVKRAGLPADRLAHWYNYLRHPSST